MAEFLHDPYDVPLMGTKMSLTFQPMLYQYAGETRVDQKLIDDLVDANPMNWETAFLNFRSQLKADQEVWVVPPGKVTDFSSQPDWVDFIIPREAIRLPALLHDDQRVKYSLVNAASDGHFRASIIIAAKQFANKDIGPKKAYLAYLGVRFGTHTGFKSAPTDAVIQEARKRWARHLGIVLSRVEFSPKYSELKIKKLP